MEEASRKAHPARTSALPAGLFHFVDKKHLHPQALWYSCTVMNRYSNQYCQTTPTGKNGGTFVVLIAHGNILGVSGL
jgi:hypothetical protein